jgi:hypothetical protein
MLQVQRGASTELASPTVNLLSDHEGEDEDLQQQLLAASQPSSFTPLRERRQAVAETPYAKVAADAASSGGQ